jgi:hypothetical protein
VSSCHFCHQRLSCVRAQRLPAKFRFFVISSWSYWSGLESLPPQGISCAGQSFLPSMSVLSIGFCCCYIAARDFGFPVHAACSLLDLRTCASIFHGRKSSLGLRAARSFVRSPVAPCGLCGFVWIFASTRPVSILSYRNKN